jgi:hypothetical protein
MRRPEWSQRPTRHRLLFFLSGYRGVRGYTLPKYGSLGADCRRSAGVIAAQSGCSPTALVHLATRRRCRTAVAACTSNSCHRNPTEPDEFGPLTSPAELPVLPPRGAPSARAPRRCRRQHFMQPPYRRSLIYEKSSSGPEARRSGGAWGRPDRPWLAMVGVRSTGKRTLPCVVPARETFEPYSVGERSLV